MRTREVWIHAVDLDNGGRFADFPEVVNEGLLTDIVGMWRKKGEGSGLVLAVDGREPIAVTDEATTTTVSGGLEAVTRWAAGRGSIGSTVDGAIDEPPRWL
jgi:maleylpyruvate isomerase